jgi:hypothetical protein
VNKHVIKPQTANPSAHPLFISRPSSSRQVDNVAAIFNRPIKRRNNNGICGNAPAAEYAVNTQLGTWCNAIGCAGN